MTKRCQCRWLPNGKIAEMCELHWEFVRKKAVYQNKIVDEVARIATDATLGHATRRLDAIARLLNIDTAPQAENAEQPKRIWRCSFCGLDQFNVMQLICGPEEDGVRPFICDECVDECCEITIDVRRKDRAARRENS